MPSQMTTTTVQTAQGKEAGCAFGALRSGSGLEGLQGDMFANLLSQITAAQKQSEATVSGKPASGLPETTSSNTTATQETGDRSALRALMQRMREDARSLYQSRQRIKHVEKKEVDDRKSCKEDEAPTADPQNEVAAPETEKSAAVTSAKETNAASETSQEGNQEEKAAEGLGEAATLDVQGLMESVQNIVKTALTEVENTLKEAGSNVIDAQTMLQDVIDAEKAALLLINGLRADNIQSKKGGEAAGEALAGEGQEAAPELIAAAPTAPAGKSAAPETGDYKHGTASQHMFPWAASVGAETDGAGQGTTSTQEQHAPEWIGSTQNAGSNQQEKNAGSAVNKNSKADFLNILNINAAEPVATQSSTPTGAAVKASAVAQIGSVSDTAVNGPSTSANAPTHATIGETAGKPVGSYDFASQLSAARATKGGSAGLPNAVEQVALQLHKQVNDGNNEMTIQLRPAELGRIDIKLLFTSDNKVVGTVVADNPATLELLSKDVGSLQRALQEAGLRADSGSLQFSLRGDGQPNYFSANSNGNGSAGNGSSGYDAPSLADVDVANETDAEVYYLTPGRINLRV